jgi:hypothetical protein
LLSRDAVVVSGVVCTVAPRGSATNGLQAIRSVIPISAANLRRLVAALRLPDHSGGSHACNTYLVGVPDFVLTLADGTRVRPGVPGDGCHPRKEVLDALAATTTAPAASTTPISQMASPQEWESGCEGEATPAAVWIGGPEPGRDWHLPFSGAASVCRYSLDGPVPTTAAAQKVTGHLTATGAATAGAVDALLITASTPATGCGPSGSSQLPPPGDWILVVPTPTPSHVSTGTFIDAFPGAVVELTGCRRVVAVKTGGLVGYLSAADAAALGALADRAVG